MKTRWHISGYALMPLFLALPVLSAFAQTPLPNPDLPLKCPYDIIFVLDESGSIVGSQAGTTVISPQIRAGAYDLIASLDGTGSRVAVVEFNSTARRAVIGGTVSYQTINTAYISAFSTYITLDNNNSPDADRYDPEDCTQCFTNWEDALMKVQTINSLEGVADLVIFFTDGMPTAYINNSGTVTQGTSAAIAQQALLDATGAANVVKTQGAHMFVVGLPNPNLPESNVQAISGPDKYPAPEPDFLKGDYSVSTSATLQQDLAALGALLITTVPTASLDYEISWTNQCDTFIVQFTNLSTGATSYYWDFGDGSFSTDSSLTHLFTAGGPFVVMLIAEQDGLCVLTDTLRDTLSFAVTLDTMWTDFGYTFTPDCDTLLVNFSGTSSHAATFTWDFGNGQFAAGNNATAVYTIPGAYPVTMIATPADRCFATDTLIKPFTFTPLSFRAAADFDYTLLYKNDCDTFVVRFDNLSSGGTSYFWDFGNGATSSDANATVTFTGGSYDITLQVNDNRRCAESDTVIKPLVFTPVFVHPLADFDFNVIVNCDDAELNFSNKSVNAQSYSWLVNNSVISNGFTPNSALVYYETAALQVELRARGFNNCAVNDTVIKSIIIPAPYGYPVVDFEFTPERPQTDELISFTNHSQGADESRYQWSFGDGNYSSEIHPRHVYAQKGEYEICLEAENEYGCPDAACKQVEIIYTAIVDLPNAFSPNGDDRNDVFTVRGKDIEKMWLRIFNRWGELVFESRDPAKGWDGTYKGEPQEMEVYVWLLDATLKNGYEVFRKGNVTLLR